MCVIGQKRKKCKSSMASSEYFPLQNHFFFLMTKRFWTRRSGQNLNHFKFILFWKWNIFQWNLNPKTHTSKSISFFFNVLKYVNIVFFFWKRLSYVNIVLTINIWCCFVGASPILLLAIQAKGTAGIWSPASRGRKLHRRPLENKSKGPKIQDLYW